MKTFTNNSRISLALAVWLCDSDYDHSDNPNLISATSLLKPLRMIVLARQNKTLDKVADVEALIPPRIGTALHSAIENTWVNVNKVKNILLAMGYPQHVVDKVLINPNIEDLKEDTIAIYMELRKAKKVGKYMISGKFDFVMEGQLRDFKSTKVYGYMKGSNKISYMQQGSIYRWLNPDIITNDTMTIDYIFTDFNALEASKNKDYPKKQLAQQNIELMSIAQTEHFINEKVSQIAALEDKPQSELPLCSGEDLWKSDDVFKYYKDPTKTARSTKNFTNAGEANARKAKEGVGTVIQVKGQVRRCKYCDVILICDQAKQMIAEGRLVI